MKQTVCILFGGCSTEHEVSCISVLTVAENLDAARYETLLIGITKEGKWLRVESTADIRSGKWRESKVCAFFSTDRTNKGVCFIREGEELPTFCSVDVVFPVLHGRNGEDGTVQGLLELTGLPYVGCGVFASACAMDKFFTKQIVERLGIRQAKCVSCFRRQLSDPEKLQSRIENEMNHQYPVFIKPANAGSSVGVTKAHDGQQLIKGLHEATQYDDKILVEEAICGRELECAVLSGNGLVMPEQGRFLAKCVAGSNNTIYASGIGEILAAAEFYDYDAKYNNADSQTVLSPELPKGTAEAIAQAAAEIFRAIDGYGLARADFFLDTASGEIIFNEINTIPGFTSISMYPMLWKQQNIAISELIDLLLLSALRRTGDEDE